MPKKWPGLPLETIRKVRLKYCRVWTRQSLLPSDPDGESNAGGMVGTLIRQMHAWLKTKHFKDFPTLTDLGEACDPKAKLNVLNKFFNGNATKGTHWFKNGRDMLRLMLVGENPNELSEEFRVFRSIETYFFRKLDADDQKKATPFFRGARRTPEPWSRREIAGEILWTLYKHEFDEWPAELVWVSGGWSFFPEGCDKPVAHATAEAAKAGVAVTFIHHSSPGGKGATTSFGDFCEKFPGAKGDCLCDIDLATEHYQTLPGWFSFANTAFQYLYLKVRNKDRTQPDDDVAILYIVRGAKLKGQAAHLADPPEQQLFEAWLEQLRKPRLAPVEAVADPVPR